MRNQSVKEPFSIRKETEKKHVHRGDEGSFNGGLLWTTNEGLAKASTVQLRYFHENCPI
jgi:hypothetical protein